MPGKSKVRIYGHPLYARNTIEIYPGSLQERSIGRLVAGATDSQIKDDMRRGGLLVEQFVDSDRKRQDFSKPNGRDIFWLLRRAMIEQGRIGDPIPNSELEGIAFKNGFFRIHARFSLRDAWKQGLSRRFVRGIFCWSTDGDSRGGKKHGIHYILTGSENVRKAAKGSR